jgi:HEAT repeat protein
MRTAPVAARVVLSLFAIVAGPSAFGIDPAKAPPEVVDASVLTPEAFQAKLKRLIELGGLPAESTTAPVVAITDAPRLRRTNEYVGDSPEAVPYMAFSLHLWNRTSSTGVLDPAQVVLNVNGQQVRFQDLPEQISGFVIDIAGRAVSVEDAVPKRPIPLPAGKVTTVVMLFAPVETKGTVPSISLQLPAAINEGAAITLDLNRLHAAVLDSNFSRVGPQGACGLVTVRGAIDGVNAGILSEKLQEMATAGVRRFVFDFSAEDLPSVDMLDWLVTMAVDGEPGAQHRSLPQLPTEVAELHFAGAKVKTLNNVVGDSRLKIHREVEAAVVDALWVPLRRSTRSAVLQELTRGDRRCRAAALSAGADVLIESDLPQVAGLLDDASETTRRAAAKVMARFDSDAARDRLAQAVSAGSSRSAAVALEALLASPRAANIEAGVRAAQGPTPLSEVELIRVLVRSGHPAFRPRIEQAAVSGGRKARLVALTAIAHSQPASMTRIFETALRSTDTRIREAALQLVVAHLQKADQRLRSVVVEEALRRMQSRPADAIAAQVAIETRDPRFVAILGAKLASTTLPPSERQAIVERLAQIGGSAATEALMGVFDRLSPTEQEVALGQIGREDPSRAVALAIRSVGTSDSSLASTVGRVLVHDASDRSVSAIRQAILSGESISREPLFDALGSIGSPAAIGALRDCLDGDNPALRMQASRVLKDYWDRSPATDAVHLAIAEMGGVPGQGNVPEAIRMFNLAAEIDRLLPDVYTGRGNAQLRLANWKEAERQFAAAAELDPFDDIAFTGLVIARIMQGQVEEPLEWLSAVSRHFPSNANFEYNCACAHSRALEQTLMQADSAERATKLRDAAFRHLDAALENGFGSVSAQEIDLVRNDPDLAPLHDDPRFQQFVEKVRNAARG